MSSLNHIQIPFKYLSYKKCNWMGRYTFFLIFMYSWCRVFNSHGSIRCISFSLLGQNMALDSLGNGDEWLVKLCPLTRSLVNPNLCNNNSTPPTSCSSQILSYESVVKSFTSIFIQIYTPLVKQAFPQPYNSHIPREKLPYIFYQAIHLIA